MGALAALFISSAAKLNELEELKLENMSLRRQQEKDIGPRHSCREDKEVSGGEEK